MAERVVVTGGDAVYFPLIEELCQSIRATGRPARSACCDGRGARGAHRAHLATRYGAHILDVGLGVRPARRPRARDAST
jgi:hypothetical protein